jgi:hypothetical protein
VPCSLTFETVREPILPQIDPSKPILARTGRAAMTVKTANKPKPKPKLGVTVRRRKPERAKRASKPPEPKTEDGDARNTEGKPPFPWKDGAVIPTAKLRPGGTEAGQFGVESVQGEDMQTMAARSLMTPEIPAALIVRNFAAASFPSGIDMTALAVMIRQRADAAASGDLDGIVGQLATSATILDAIADEMFRRAALNMGTHLEATESYMRMGLRASAESRAKLEAIAEIKNPRPVYVRNLNQAHGNQQINQTEGPQQINNNGHPPAGTTRAEETGIGPNKLLGAE